MRPGKYAEHPQNTSLPGQRLLGTYSVCEESFKRFEFTVNKVNLLTLINK